MGDSWAIPSVTSLTDRSVCYIFFQDQTLLLLGILEMSPKLVETKVQFTKVDPCLHVEESLHLPLNLTTS